MESLLEVEGHALWPGEEEASVFAESASAGSQNMLFLVSGEAPFEQEVVANITRLLGIPWNNAYCFDRDRIASSPAGTAYSIASAVDKISSKLRKQRGTQKRSSAGRRFDDPRALVLIPRIDQFVNDHLLELDFLFSATGSTSIASSHMDGAIFLLTFDPLALGPSADKNRDSRISLKEFKSFLADKLNNNTISFNGEALVGRVQRFAIEQRQLPESFAPAASDSLCTFIQERRKELFQTESVMAKSGSLEMTFSVFLAICSIPLILFYAWKRWLGRRRLVKNLSRKNLRVDVNIVEDVVDSRPSADGAHTDWTCDTLPAQEKLLQSSDTSRLTDLDSDRQPSHEGAGKKDSQSAESSEQENGLIMSRSPSTDTQPSMSGESVTPDSSNSHQSATSTVSPAMEEFSRLQASNADTPEAKTVDKIPPDATPSALQHSSVIRARSASPARTVDLRKDNRASQVTRMETRSRTKATGVKEQTPSEAETKTRRKRGATSKDK